MKNADKPIYPIVGNQGFVTNEFFLWHNDLAGLTKREYFAAMAMQGLLTRPYLNMGEAATKAVEAADVLLKTLDETKSE